MRERRARPLPGRARARRVPVIAVLPSMFVTATFCRRVVSWRGVLFGHNRTRPPPYMGWRGPCSACLTRLASFPAHPAPAADRQGRVPARGASFPAPPTSPELPPGDTRFRRPPGPNTRARCQFPSSSHVPEVTPGWCPFPAPPGPNTRARCQFPSSSHVPGVSSRWCPFPAVNEFLLLSRGAAQAPRGNN